VVETAFEASLFSKVTLPTTPMGSMTANPRTSNDPLSVLTDGKLAEGYGPVFANGVVTGVYRMNLGQSKRISLITSWSTNVNGNRGPQRFSLYGSNAINDPGWALEDRSQFTPLGTINTTLIESDKFNATRLRMSSRTFRWIYWQVSPVTSLGENSAFQEFRVE